MTKSALSRGVVRAPTRTTLSKAAEEWLAASQAGIVRTRSGETYKPSALRSYKQALALKVLPELGHLRLSAISRNTVQDLVDRLVAQGFSASTVRNSILPLRAIYRRAVWRSEVLVNPTLGLALPAVRGRRERVARPCRGPRPARGLDSRGSRHLGHRALRWASPWGAAGTALERYRLRGRRPAGGAKLG
jgi:hypothetical protein